MVPPSVTSNPKTTEEEKEGAASAPVHISNWPSPETSANCAKDTVQLAMVMCKQDCRGKGLQDWWEGRACSGHNSEGGLPSEHVPPHLAASVPQLLPRVLTPDSACSWEPASSTWPLGSY